MGLLNSLSAADAAVHMSHVAWAFCFAVSAMQVTIPENGQSFALIYSIEDPGDPSSPVGGLGVQVMLAGGPAAPTPTITLLRCITSCNSPAPGATVRCT
jgi:hypothetical protein